MKLAFRAGYLSNYNFGGILRTMFHACIFVCRHNFYNIIQLKLA